MLADELAHIIWSKMKFNNDQILDLSELESKCINLGSVVFDVNLLLADLAEVYSKKVKGSGVQFDIEFSNCSISASFWS